MQKDRRPKFRSPWSVAGGASYSWPGTAVHFTTEWFEGVGPFDVLNSELAPVVGSDETIPPALHSEHAAMAGFGSTRRVYE